MLFLPLDCVVTKGPAVKSTSICSLSLMLWSFIGVTGRDASIRYSGSVSAQIRSFSADRVSVRRDRSKSDIVCIHCKK